MEPNLICKYGKFRIMDLEGTGRLAEWKSMRQFTKLIHKDMMEGRFPKV